MARDHPKIAPEVIAERVAKAWEPHCPEIFARIPSADLRSMLDEYGTTISALRVSAVEYTMSVIENAMRPPDARLALVVGRVQAVKPTASGQLAVTVATPRDAQNSADTRVIEADLVVSNFAREPDYRRVRQPLWRNLLAKGLAVPHERTGRGVEVDEHGTLLGNEGEPIGPVFAVGVLREGDEIVRNGRTGAFAFNLATIKNQSIAVAARAIELLDPQEPAGLADCRALGGGRGESRHVRTSGPDRIRGGCCTGGETDGDASTQRAGTDRRAAGRPHPVPGRRSRRGGPLSA